MRYRTSPATLFRRPAWLLFLLTAAACGAQQGGLTALAAATDPAAASLQTVLYALAQQADVIFVGEVAEVRRTPAAVEIHWQVEDGIRGAVAGQQYTLSEWPGLWTDAPRYTQGQRALLLLHAPSAAGYASPVGGADGVVALHGDGVSGSLDLRLLQQRVQVTDVARLRPARALEAAGGSLALSDALQRSASAAAQPARPRPAGAPRARALLRIDKSDVGNLHAAAISTAPAAQTPAAAQPSTVDADVVLGMLHAWQRQRGAAR